LQIEFAIEWNEAKAFARRLLLGLGFQRQGGRQCSAKPDRLSLQAQMPVDYEAMNWYTSTHPDSLLVRSLIAARPGRHRRHTLINDNFTIRHLDGKVERRILSGAKEFGKILTRHSGITTPDSAEIEAVSAIAAKRAASPDFFERSRWLD
jgi:arylamine N-acetyltransferase